MMRLERFDKKLNHKLTKCNFCGSRSIFKRSAFTMCLKNVQPTKGNNNDDRRKFYHRKINHLLCETALELLKDQTNFGMEELRSLHRRFEREAGENMVLDREQFQHFLFTLGIDNEHIVNRTFKLFDLDGNGTIDFREFASGMSKITRGSALEKLEFSFNIWDSDNDGLLCKQEYRGFLEGLSETRTVIDDHSFERIWADIENTHGKVNCAEALRGASSLSANPPLIFEDHQYPEDHSHHEKQVISLLAERIHLTKGEVIFHQGSLDSYFYILLDGTIELSRNGISFAHLTERGDIVGCESLVGSPSSKRATCSSDYVDLWRLRIDDMMPCMSTTTLLFTSIVYRSCLIHCSNSPFPCWRFKFSSSMLLFGSEN
eukprot:TRINITY_DN91_c0_g1_i3.p1 TRINITY_DN91_c0_g1~~TRINITY_DN91_c0_g1_i3.p1  ORF type:complete len:374 (-),score=48.75 TRINITY_DN91_c0_g1_i3:358-1479(-)